jgi:DNA polymerase III subunit chi
LQDTKARIDFYVLETTTASERMHFACRLIEKAYKANHKIYVLTNSSSQSSEIDKLLWTFRNDCFIPHDLSEESNNASTPIIIGHKQPDAMYSELLVNLSDAMTFNLKQFQRIIEIIDATENIRNIGRKRFSNYRAAGLTPETHNINST